MTARLFVALDIDEAIKEQLATFRMDIRGASWVKPESLHLTLRFIGGQVDERQIPQIDQALQEIIAAPFPFHLQGVGVFPPSKRPPRVLWAGIEAPPRLLTLQQSVESALLNLGFPHEERPFRPHITLARFKTPPPSDLIQRFLQEHQEFMTVTMSAFEFKLISSTLTSQGPQYHTLGTYVLHPLPEEIEDIPPEP